VVLTLTIHQHRFITLANNSNLIGILHRKISITKEEEGITIIEAMVDIKETTQEVGTILITEGITTKIITEVVGIKEAVDTRTIITKEVEVGIIINKAEEMDTTKVPMKTHLYL
jgi:hypothetical protein